MHQNTNSIILRRIAYGEADMVVTFISRDLGRQSGFARSARKSVKRFGGALEPGTLVNLSLTSGRENMMRIEEARVLRSVTGLMKSLERIDAMTFAIELALAFLKEGQPQEEKFDLLNRWLENISSQNPCLSDKIAYELEWLKYSGFAPQINGCAACNFAGEGRRWFFDFDHGGVFCSTCAEKLKGARVALSKTAVSGLGRIGKENIEDLKIGAEIHSVLSRYINHIVGRTLVGCVF